MTKPNPSPSARRDNEATIRPLSIVGRPSVLLLVATMIVVGAGLRVVRLDQVPPGLNQDEACNGYDAYSILSTGRDQHGNFLPLAIQAFNDYRMPLFDYSLVPLVGVFGLKPAAVRMGAAIWGVLDLAAITSLAGLILGWPGAFITAILAGFSPWQLPFSRFGHEAITASATIDLAMVCLFLWLKRLGDRWLLLSGALFGLSLYSYSISKAFVPLMLVLLAFLYRNDFRRAGRPAAQAIAIVLLFAFPQLMMLLSRTREMQARFEQISVFGHSAPLLDRLKLFGSGFASYFGPSFLFIHGDHSVTLHPQGFGELLPEQAVLIAVGLIAMMGRRRRKIGWLLLGWLMLAALPASMLLGSPHSQHDLLAFAPWMLFSALGFTSLIDLVARPAALRIGIPAVIAAATIVHGVLFGRAYFNDYPLEAERIYHLGMDKVVQEIGKPDPGTPVVMTPLNQGYIYVLFFQPYPPASFQRTPMLGGKGLFATVVGFDRYAFTRPRAVYDVVAHAIFVYPGDETPPVPPKVTIRYLDGTDAYKIVVK
jgi:hypothetical protein